MKAKTGFFLALTVLASLFQVSCDRASDTSSQTLVAAQDNSAALRLFHILFTMAHEAGQSLDQQDSALVRVPYINGVCTDLTITPAWPDPTFPKTVVLDYGRPGCPGSDGRPKSGRVNITFSGLFGQSGTVVTVVPDSLILQTNQITGTYTITNMGGSGGTVQYGEQITNGQVTFSNGDVTTYNFSGTRSWLEGVQTSIYNVGSIGAEDDVYSITGSCEGVNTSGVNYTSTISTPVVLSNDCNWTRSGVIDVNPQDNDAGTLQFGDGECDKLGNVAVSGTTFEFIMF